jgi:hypothetical protein
MDAQPSRITSRALARLLSVEMRMRSPSRT